MPADSLAVALMALDDPGIRSQIREGDFSGLHPDVVLSSKEESLLKAAAAEEIDPETSWLRRRFFGLFHRCQRRVPGNVNSAPVANAFQAVHGQQGRWPAAPPWPARAPAPMAAIGFASYEQDAPGP